MARKPEVAVAVEPDPPVTIEDTAGIAAVERCWIAEGRLHVLYDGSVFGSRSRVQVIADSQATYDLAGEVHSVGAQLLQNGDFSSDMAGWALVDSPTADLGIDLSPEWTLRDGHTAFVRDMDAASLPATLRYVGGSDSGLIPVTPGRSYHLSLLLAAHRCTAEVALEFLDGELDVLTTARRRFNAGSPGGQEAGAYDEVNVAVAPPDRARWARLMIGKSATAAGAADSYLFLAHVAFGWAGAERIDHSALRAAYDSLARWGSPRMLSADLPPQLSDGMPHDLRVVDPEARREISGSPIAMKPLPTFDGGVEDIEGPLIRGWVRERQEPGSTPEVAIEVDGTEVGRVVADLQHPTGENGFRVIAPARFLDGRGHHVVVRALPSGAIVSQSVRVLPRSLTPWEAIRAHASDPLPADLDPAAAYRYRSMQMTIDAAAAGDSSAQQRLRQLGIAHRALVNGFERNRDFLPLEFPSHDEPAVSVVVPVHDQRAVTYNCLAALIFAHNETPFEVVVVDDASTDETQDLADLVTGVTFIRNEENRGFVHSCNAGAQRARGRYIVFLNNDTEPTARWIDEMLLVFRNFEDVGLVGSRLLYPDGRLQEAGGIIWSNGEPWNYGRGHNPHLPQFGFSRQADYLSGASLMVDRDTWDEVGGFGEEYAPAYFEDTDLAFKVRAAGKKTVYAPHSVVFHHEGTSNGTETSGSGMKRYQEINRPTFAARWAAEFGQQPGIDVEPRLAAASRGAPKRALFVDHALPQPDRSAGGYAEIQEIRLVQSLGYQVSFFPENLAWLAADTEYLQRMGVEVLHAPFYFSLEQVLQERGGELDLVYVTRFDTALRAIEPTRRLAPQAKIALTLADLHFMRQIRDAISGVGSLDDARGTRDRELHAIREADVTLSYSDVEHAVILSHNLESGNVAKAPWVADVEESIPGPEERGGLAFLGSYAHPPNRQAVEFFCEQVMPRLRDGGTEVTFHVYGSGWPDGFRQQFATRDVVFEGFVDSVADAYGHRRVAVAPLVSGAGLKGKVIDALTHGVPQVLSPIAAEGTGLRDGLEVLIAETPEEWLERLTTLLADDERWARMSEAARAFAQDAYSFERNQAVMRRALESAGAYASPSKAALVAKDARPDWRAGTRLEQ